MKTFRELREGRSINKETIPNPTLILRRRGIRSFPDGKKVAMYTNDQYNLVITIPYGGKGEPVVTGHM